MNNDGFKKESKMGREFEKSMIPILGSVGAIPIDGKWKSKPIGQKYKSSLQYIPGFEKISQNCWLDFVIETGDGPIFVDCKSTAITHKDRDNIFIKAMAYKNKFPTCKIVLIYKNLNTTNSENKRNKETLLLSGMIDMIYETADVIINNPSAILGDSDIIENGNSFF
jgi:hypothetical protein